MTSIPFEELPLRANLIGGMALSLEPIRSVGLVSDIQYSNGILAIYRRWFALEVEYHDDLPESTWYVKEPPGEGTLYFQASLAAAESRPQGNILLWVFGIGGVALFPSGIPVIDLRRVRGLNAP